jgi:Fe-S cluster biogenesis protein NfuA
MTQPPDDRDFRKRMERLERLLHEVEHFPDPEARAHTREIVQAILALHGAGLEKLLDTIAEGKEGGVALIEAVARDDLVANLLLLHGLHPLDLETRVRQALDRVRPQLRAHGAGVELLGVARGVVRLRLVGSCDGCASSAANLKHAVEEAVTAAAPDAARIEVEGVTNGHPAGGPARIALPLLRG